MLNDKELWKQWDFEKIMKNISISILIILSFFLPHTRALWNELDNIFFFLLNKTLLLGKPIQYFWAYFNSSIADRMQDIVFVFAFIYIYLKSPKEKKRDVIFNLFFTALAIFLTIFFINRGIFKVWKVHRESPTLIFDSAIRLSKLITDMKVKDISHHSFPADHATTAILLTSLYYRFSTSRIRYPLTVYALFLCLPRMVTGAHWLSDALVGSVPIVLISWAFFFYTPFYATLKRGFDTLVSFVILKNSKQKTV